MHVRQLPDRHTTLVVTSVLYAQVPSPAWVTITYVVRPLPLVRHDFLSVCASVRIFFMSGHDASMLPSNTPRICHRIRTFVHVLRAKIHYKFNVYTRANRWSCRPQQRCVRLSTLSSLLLSLCHDDPEVTSGHTTYITRNILLIIGTCLLYTSPSPRDGLLSRMPSSA